MSEVSLGLIEKQEIEAAVSIYLQAFPQRASLWFRHLQQSQVFFKDLLELMRLAHGDTFFAARCDGRLAGFLILTTPQKRLLSVILRPGFFTRVITHTLSGRYGFSPAFLKKLSKDLLNNHLPETGQSLNGNPHIYVIVVDAQHAGHGIGSSLLSAAITACREEYNRLWLLVEPENTTAVGFYKSRGFQAVFSDTSQVAMVLDLALAVI